jgi:hypothetical protein
MLEIRRGGWVIFKLGGHHSRAKKVPQLLEMRLAQFKNALRLKLDVHNAFRFTELAFQPIHRLQDTIRRFYILLSVA